MKLLEIEWNWRCSPITFSISFPMILSRTIGLKDLEESYNFLLGLEMTMNVDVLKWEGQWSSSKHASVMLMILLRHTLSWMILLRCLHDSLSRPGVNELLYLAIELVNSFSEKGTHIIGHLFGISSRVQMSICWSWAVLNDEWRAY